MLFIILINGVLLGLLVAAITAVFTTSMPAAVTVGLGATVFFVAVCVWSGNRHFRRAVAEYQPVLPSPPKPGA